MRRAAALMALLALGCEGPDFASPSLVDSTRLIAVIADPPESAPGTDVALDALVVGPGADEVTVSYAVDLSPRALAASAGQDLFEASAPEPIEGGALSGARTRDAVDELLARLGDARAGTPEAVVRQVFEEVGLIATVRVEVRDASGELVVEAFKRVGLHPAPSAPTNPPPPRFAVDGRWASAREGDPSACLPEGDPLLVERGALVVLSPEPDEGWLERYPALDLAGRTFEGEENAYYSWFSTGGDFQFDVTRAPEREVEWTAPAEPGVYPLWLVVRDGHLGTSACRAQIEVR